MPSNQPFFVISQLCVISVGKVSSLSALWVVIELDPHLYHFQREMCRGVGDSGIQVTEGCSKDFCGFEIFDFG